MDVCTILVTESFVRTFDFIFVADNHDIISVKFYELESQLSDDVDYTKVQPSASLFSPPRGESTVHSN